MKRLDSLRYYNLQPIIISADASQCADPASGVQDRPSLSPNWLLQILKDTLQGNKVLKSLIVPVPEAVARITRPMARLVLLLVQFIERERDRER